ncbi:hypothetical protein CISIN_1g043216mg [Citrus sinensis]|uniref:F-box domain-containing protein n=1 Tax=Citrus sinensis TaxID=2711 RepID=A0A067E5Z0_CITSI|nr:hypothetical protein CISIN_1g043216mg [Citrus sinensis]
MSENIPLDIIIKIFIRQPVNSLLRFRCISKTCCSLIDGPDFIKQHLNHSIGDKKTTLDMGLLEGCPCVVCNYDSVYFDVWMMKEYGGLFKGPDKFLLKVNCQKFVWYDLEKKILRSVKIKNHDPDVFAVKICLGSLVPPSGGRGGDGLHGMKPHKQEERKKRKKKRDDFLSTGFKLVL